MEVIFVIISIIIYILLDKQENQTESKNEFNQ